LTTFESPGATAVWKLEAASDSSRFVISETVSGKSYAVAPAKGIWQLSSNS
jgi:hypothetical protein